MGNRGLLGWATLILVVVGGVNWGLVGAFEFDLVATLFGAMSTISRAVYVLVGLAALYMAYSAFSSSSSSPSMM